jgi:hypothetical protein
MYPYITENNLIHKQSYQYSQYKGIGFLHEYEATRNQFLVKESQVGCLGNNFSKEVIGEAFDHTLTNDSEGIYTAASLVVCMLNSENAESDRGIIESFLKSFEVRKRLYRKYDHQFKPLVLEYTDPIPYVILAWLMNKQFMLTGNYKFINGSLKLTDTILSIADSIVPRWVRQLAYETIQMEVETVRTIMRDKGI